MILSEPLFRKRVLRQTPCMSDGPSGRGGPADSSDSEKKRKRPESPPLQFVNITHPNQSKTKDVLKTVRQHAMHNHLYRNSAPDLAESERVTRLPRRLRSLINNSLETPMPEPRSQRSSSVPGLDADGRSFLVPAPSQRLSRRVSSMDVPSTQLQPQPSLAKGRSRSEDSNATGTVQQFEQYAQPSRPSTDFQEHVENLARNCEIFFGSEELDRQWRSRGAEDRMFYLSSLCVSARHTESLEGTTGCLNTLALDTEVVKSINEKLQDSQEQASDNTIASALHVAICYNYSDPGRVDWYNLIRTLVELRGGLDGLTTFPFLSSAVLINGLASAIFQEATPDRMFLSAAYRTPRNTNRNLESPLCWSKTGFGRLESSRRCTKQLFALLQAVRHAVEVVTRGDSSPRSRQWQYQEQSDYIRSELLTFRHPDGSGISGESPEQTYVYEACRVAAIIMERALFYGMPLSEAVRGRDLLYNLKDALLKTDLDSSWGDMAGVLLWAAYVGAAASNGIEEGNEETRRLRAWLVGCATRVTIKTAFTHCNDIVRALLTLSQIQEVCALPKE